MIRAPVRRACCWLEALLAQRRHGRPSMPGAPARRTARRREIQLGWLDRP